MNDGGRLLNAPAEWSRLWMLLGRCVKNQLFHSYRPKSLLAYASLSFCRFCFCCCLWQEVALTEKLLSGLFFVLQLPPRSASAFYNQPTPLILSCHEKYYRPDSTSIPFQVDNDNDCVMMTWQQGNHHLHLSQIPFN